MLPRITISGNVCSDVDLKFTQSGKPFAKFRIAANKRRKNEQTGEWEDAGVFFGNVTVWSRFDNDTQPENVVNTIVKGMAVRVEGQVETRTYTTESGEERLSVDVDADAVAVELRNATAVVTREPSRDQGQQQRQQQAPPPQGEFAGAPRQDDDPPF